MAKQPIEPARKTEKTVARSKRFSVSSFLLADFVDSQRRVNLSLPRWSCDAQAVCSAVRREVLKLDVRSGWQRNEGQRDGRSRRSAQKRKPSWDNSRLHHFLRYCLLFSHRCARNKVDSSAFFLLFIYNTRLVFLLSNRLSQREKKSFVQLFGIALLR